MTTQSLPYRRNVAVVVLNDDGLLLACRRSDEYKTWQLPQGGIDAAEDAEDALYRELGEEIGTSAVDMIGKLDEPIRYEWPEHLHTRGYRGQEQQYFLVRLRTGEKLDLTLYAPPEFDSCEWLTANAFIARLAEFKKEAYVEALNKLAARFPGTIKFA